jgi:hypothetical protein
MKLQIDSIKLDPDLQPRVALDQETIDKYAAAMERGVILPAVVVFHDASDYWLADGFHRIYAAKQTGATEIDANVQNGGKRDALIFSVSANADHGLPRSRADTRRAIMALLADPELSKLSDRKLGEMARADHKTIGKYRAELGGEFPNRAETARHTPLSIPVLEFFGYEKLPWALTRFEVLPNDLKQDIIKRVPPELDKFVAALKDCGITDLRGDVSLFGMGPGIQVILHPAYAGGWWIHVSTWDKVDETDEDKDGNEDETDVGYTNKNPIYLDVVPLWIYHTFGPNVKLSTVFHWIKDPASRTDVNPWTHKLGRIPVKMLPGCPEGSSWTYPTLVNTTHSAPLSSDTIITLQQLGVLSNRENGVDSATIAKYWKKLVTAEDVIKQLEEGHSLSASREADKGERLFLFRMPDHPRFKGNKYVKYIYVDPNEGDTGYMRWHACGFNIDILRELGLRLELDDDHILGFADFTNWGVMNQDEAKVMFEKLVDNLKLDTWSGAPMTLD